jgi:hypothetical protein
MEERTMGKLALGARVEYLGDAMNLPGFGTVVEVRSAGLKNHFKVKLDDHRTFWISDRSLGFRVVEEMIADFSIRGMLV